ncbi:MAG: hypothetical protein AB1938_22160 [Myxococcota bacterium]
MRLFLPLSILAVLVGCHDFDEAFARCLDGGRCSPQDAGVVDDAGPGLVHDGGFFGCADPHRPGNQYFGSGFTWDASFHLFGCTGAVSYASREALCARDAGCFSCGVDWWLSRSGKAVVPSSDYWTNDALGFASGSSGTCSVDYEGNAPACTRASDGGLSPVRICARTGSGCEVNRCGFQSTTADDFGGCGEVTTAGSLCACE